MRSITAAKPATTPIPSHSPNRSSPPLSSRPSRCPSVGRRANWAIIASLISSCGSSTPGCSGSARPCRKTSLGNRPFTTRPSTQSLPNGPMMDRSGKRSWPVCGSGAAQPPPISACCMATEPTPWPKKGAMALATLGSKYEKGRKSSPSRTTMALSWLPCRLLPSMRSDMILLPQGLNALQQGAKQVGLDLKGASLTLDGGFDSARNRKCMFNAGMIPTIPKTSLATARASSVGGSDASMQPFMCCGCVSNGPLPGKRSSSGSYYALNVSSSGIMA